MRWHSLRKKPKRKSQTKNRFGGIDRIGMRLNDMVIGCGCWQLTQKHKVSTIKVEIWPKRFGPSLFKHTKTNRVYISTIYRQRMIWSTTSSNLVWSWRWFDKRKVVDRIRKVENIQRNNLFLESHAGDRKTARDRFFSPRWMDFLLFMRGLNGWVYADGQFAVTVAVAWQSNGLANFTKIFCASKTQAQCSRRNSIESIHS